MFSAVYGLPQSDSPLSLAFCIALGAQISILLGAAGFLFLSAALAAVSLFPLAWRWSGTVATSSRFWLGANRPLRSCVVATLLTMAALVPLLDKNSHGLGGGRNLPPQQTRADDHSPGLQWPSSDYVGIILWPPPKKLELVAPTFHRDSFLVGTASKPVVIPFDGPYWYFKTPDRNPGPRAHIAHGKPTDVNVRSTDLRLLVMEAHQNLKKQIDLAACSEIDVNITNADNRPGSISVTLRLTDSTPTANSTQELGDQLIQSSNLLNIPTKRPPVKETLRFPIPRSRSIDRFNGITFIFDPSRQRERMGAKVAIDSFVLVPG